MKIARSIPLHLRTLVAIAATPLALVSWAAIALAQTAPPSESGTPPADLAQAVAAPKAADAPIIDAPTTDSTNAAVSAGGQYAAGNSRMFSATGLGKFDMRRGANGFGAQLVGNFAEGATPPATDMKATSENLQGKLRYDRYFTPAFGAFLQVTGTHDAFQAITFRLNVDPGVKLFIVDEAATKFWGELGYDFEFDANYTDSNGIEQAGPGGPALDSKNLPYVIKKQNTIHSSRLFAGLKHSFNDDVQLNVGLEYLQGLGGTGTGTPDVPSGYTAAQVDPVAVTVTGARINGDVLVTSKLGAGFSLGVGLSEKFNGAPLAGKEKLDSTGTLSIIYSLASSPPPPPSPPAASPAPSAAPVAPVAPALPAVTPAAAPPANP